MGNLTIDTDGLMTACNASVSNLTACNINGDLLIITSTNVFMNAPRITTQSSSLLFSSSNSTNNQNTHESEVGIGSGKSNPTSLR
jgi:hypothetical protein